MERIINKSVIIAIRLSPFTYINGGSSRKMKLFRCSVMFGYILLDRAVKQNHILNFCCFLLVNFTKFALIIKSH